MYKIFKKFSVTTEHLRNKAKQCENGYLPGCSGHDVINTGSLKAIEGGGHGYGVCTHVLEKQPVADLQVGQLPLLHNAVEPITSRAPNTAWVNVLIRLGLLQEIELQVSLGEEQQSKVFGGQTHFHTLGSKGLTLAWSYRTQLKEP